MSVTEQYDAFPYPARDPKDEAKRLIIGSPSHPLEIDHFLFAGQRDWSKPIKILVAGGGTGDALIQMAQVLTSVGAPYEMTYLDLSISARAIAEDRAKVRKLTGITFVTGSLLEAPDLGSFDYIDCCGVLHHLPEPQLGFDALAAALTPGGGMGLMVYAPIGRSGVYPLQEAFGTLLQGSPQERLRHAKTIYDRIPASHPFKRNQMVRDHEESDAGFYDLLLHSQDRPYSIRQLYDALAAAGLEITGFPQAALYDPSFVVPEPHLLVGLDAITRMEIAEQLGGSLKTHIVYAAKTSNGRTAKASPRSVPHLKGVKGARMASHVGKNGILPVSLGPLKFQVPISAVAARLLVHVDGRKTLAEIAQLAKLDPLAFNALWSSMSDDLVKFGLLYYSRLQRTT
jgi:SAM-dependent methyltransferase